MSGWKIFVWIERLRSCVLLVIQENLPTKTLDSGRAGNTQSFVYIFIDILLGGALVLENPWRGGLFGNAGAICCTAAMRPTQKFSSSWIVKNTSRDAIINAALYKGARYAS